MLPIGDDNSDRHRTPYINYVFIALNIYVFIVLQGMGSNLEFTYAYATIPAEILGGVDLVTQPQILVDPLTGKRFNLPGLQVTPVPVYLTLLTGVFMHGGWAHLFGNMLYLWVFGDNIENRLGHFRYLGFYLLCGLLASLSHVLSTLFLSQNAMIPSLGASGAISGVLGAYIMLYPLRKVNMLLFVFVVSVPAFIALGIWIAFQVINGLGVLGGAEDGVAYAAHIGGFIAGLLLIKRFDKHGVDPVKVQRKRGFF